MTLTPEGRAYELRCLQFGVGERRCSNVANAVIDTGHSLIPACVDHVIITIGSYTGAPVDNYGNRVILMHRLTDEERARCIEHEAELGRAVEAVEVDWALNEWRRTHIG